MSEVIRFLWQTLILYLFTGFMLRLVWRSKAKDLRKKVERMFSGPESLKVSARAVRHWDDSQRWLVWPLVLWGWNRDTKAEWESWNATQRLKMLEQIRLDAQEKQAKLDARLKREEAERNGGAETIDPGRFPDSP